jgi:Spy/CpxP family protein refolding chaperone
LVPGGEERLAARLMAALENDRVKAYLNLSDPQVDRLRQILVDAEKAGVKARADIAVRGIELRELLRADKPDRDTVIRKVQEISDLRGQLMKERIEALLAVKGVLTPEQQKKIRSFIGRRAARQPTGGRMGFGMRREGFGPPRPETTPRAPAPPARPGEPPVQ